VPGMLKRFIVNNTLTLQPERLKVKKANLHHQVYRYRAFDMYYHRLSILSHYILLLMAQVHTLLFLKR
jgi:hypothetical protein